MCEGKFFIRVGQVLMLIGAAAMIAVAGLYIYLLTLPVVNMEAALLGTFIVSILVVLLIATLAIVMAFLSKKCYRCFALVFFVFLIVFILAVVQFAVSKTVDCAAFATNTSSACAENFWCCIVDTPSDPEYALIFEVQQYVLMCGSFVGTVGSLLTWCAWKKRMDNYDF